MHIPPKDTKHSDSAPPPRQESLDRHALYAADRTSRDTSAVFHVLDALEPPAGKQRMLRGGLILLAGACLIAAMALLINRYSDDVRGRTEGLSGQATGGEPAEKLPKVLKSAISQDAIPDAFAAMASSTMSQAVAGADTVRAPAIEPLPAANAMKRPVAVDKAGERSTVREPRKPQHKVQSQASRKTAPNETRMHASARDRKLKLSRQQDQGTKRMLVKGNADTPEKSKRKDADVDLIAALLTRVPNKSSGPGNAGTVEKTAQTLAGTEIRSPEQHASLGGRTANADVVIRTQADTTESLVKRCSALGLIEGQFCRARICSGLWGKDAACPLSSPANLH